MGFFIINEHLSHATCSPVSPYFRVTPKPHGGPKTDWVLSTKYTDSELGLIYYGYRFYQPETGRWCSRDPIKTKREFNLYAFCWNSSVMYVDTLGEWPKLLPPHEQPKQLPPHNGEPPKQLPPHKEPPSKPPKCNNKCEFPKLKAWGKAIDSAGKLDEVTSWITGGAVVVTFIECNKLYAGCISCTGDPVCSVDSCDKLCNVAKLCFEYAGKAGEAVE